MGRIQERMEQDLALRGVSDNTRETYVRYARQFVAFHKRSPRDLGTEDVADGSCICGMKGGLSARTVNVGMTALRFLFGTTLRRAPVMGDVRRMMVDHPEPDILSGTEVVRLFEVLVQLSVRGRAFLGYSEDDPVGRDVAVATLLRARVKGTEITRLLGVSSGHVSNVKKRFEAGGLSALAVRRRPGPKDQLTTAQVRRLEAMHHDGKTLREIATRLKIAPSTVHRYLGLRRAETKQEPLWVGREAGQAEAPDVEAPTAKAPCEATPAADEPAPEELCPATPLEPSTTEHVSRYAGTLLLSAALHELGVGDAWSSTASSTGGGA